MKSNESNQIGQIKPSNEANRSSSVLEVQPPGFHTSSVGGFTSVESVPTKNGRAGNGLNHQITAFFYQYIKYQELPPGPTVCSGVRICFCLNVVVGSAPSHNIGHVSYQYFFPNWN